MNTSVPTDAELASDRFAPGLLGFAERGWVPDFLLRAGIRNLCAQRLREEQNSVRKSQNNSQEKQNGTLHNQAQRDGELIETLRYSPIAIHTDAANVQHYELPPEFFKLCLGQHLKYSCCYYAHGNETLERAEIAMLELYAARAELADGQDILELGCGWGSLTLWMAERYHNARIVAVSNSHSQRLYIEAQCQQRGLTNVRVLTCDVNALALDTDSFDRCVSIEMFEHMRNYEALLARIASWLRPRGKLFVHIFAHQTLIYPFKTVGEDNWLGRHFFTGGLMPAADTLLWFQRDLSIEQRWKIDGTHYQRTANHWLANQDRHREQVICELTKVYGENLATLWFQRWRMFWMACAELFGYEHGRQWLVAHYRFARSE